MRSQSSTVMALQRVNPAQRFAELFRGALPVLRIFEQQGTAFGDALLARQLPTASIPQEHGGHVH